MTIKHTLSNYYNFVVRILFIIWFYVVENLFIINETTNQNTRKDYMEIVQFVMKLNMGVLLMCSVSDEKR